MFKHCTEGGGLSGGSWPLPFSQSIMKPSIQMHPTMKKSPGPEWVTDDCGGYGFDPWTDFSQFLEEAKQHASEANFKASSVYPEESRSRRLEKEQKSKKSWKATLLSWWKGENKSKPRLDQNCMSHAAGSTKCHVSGPIYEVRNSVSSRHRRPASGPLMNLFNPSKNAETEIPYACLQQVNSPRAVQTYGPLYLVT